MASNKNGHLTLSHSVRGLGVSHSVRGLGVQEWLSWQFCLRSFVRLQVRCELKAQSSAGGLGLENLPPGWRLLMESSLVLAVGRGPQVFAKCTSPLDSFSVLTQVTDDFRQSK